MRVNRSESATVATLAATARAPKLAQVDPATIASARRAVRRARIRRAVIAVLTLGMVRR